MAETVFSKPLDSEVTSLNDAITNLNTPVAITVTAASGVTINDQCVYRVGKIVCVNVSVTIGSTALGSTDNIITGLPAPIASVPVVGCKNLGGGNSQAFLSTGGTIRNNWDGFEASKKYFFNFCYATA